MLPSKPKDAVAFAEGSDERARMGRISGVLWTVAALVGIAGAFLPGAVHLEIGWIVALGVAVLLYGVGSVTGVIPWQNASMNALAIGMAVTVPIVGVAIYITGGAISYVEPFLVCSLLYAAFFFPARWAWPLSIELVLVAGAPLLYEGEAIDYAFVPRYLALVASFLAAAWVMIGLKRRLVAAEAYQREIANRDPLTGVGNRRVFDAALQGELEARRHPGRREGDESPLALLVFDLDDFKGVNDRYGHQVGDTVLQEAARHALSVLRSTDTLARIGGDEFAIIAPGAHGEGAARMAESVREAVACAEPGEDVPAPSASVGWAVFPDDGQDFETLLRSADERLMRLKRVSWRDDGTIDSARLVG